jgi:hypothetical protein
MYPMCNSKSESSLKIELISEKNPQKPKIVEKSFGLPKEFTCGKLNVSIKLGHYLALSHQLMYLMYDSNR